MGDVPCVERSVKVSSRSIPSGRAREVRRGRRGRPVMSIFVVLSGPPRWPPELHVVRARRGEVVGFCEVEVQRPEGPDPRGDRGPPSSGHREAHREWLNPLLVRGKVAVGASEARRPGLRSLGLPSLPWAV